MDGVTMHSLSPHKSDYIQVSCETCFSKPNNIVIFLKSFGKVASATTQEIITYLFPVKPPGNINNQVIVSPSKKFITMMASFRFNAINQVLGCVVLRYVIQPVNH
jgi:hypothetical protein